MRISDWSSDVCSSDLSLMQQRPDQGAPLVKRARLADAIGRQLLMAAIDHLLVFRTPQDVDHMCAAVAFAALRQPRDTGQQLLRFQRQVFGDFGRSEEHTYELQ